MTQYAENTTVSSEKSRAEIERTLTRYGADEFMYGTREGQAIVMFKLHGRQIRYLLTMPAKKDYHYTTARRTRRTEAAALEAWEKACRQRWRSLALNIKAKLDAVTNGIACFEDEFMAQIVLPDGSTVGEFMRPQIESAYSTGEMPPMLPLLN